MWPLENIVAMNDGEDLNGATMTPVKGFLRRKVLNRGQAPLGTYLWRDNVVSRDFATALMDIDAPMTYKPWEDGVVIDINDGEHVLYWRDDA